MTLRSHDYHLQSDDDLREAHSHWDKAVETSGGWQHAYYAACQLEAIVAEGKKRGLGLVNRFPVLRAFDGLPLRPEKGDLGHFTTSGTMHLDNKGM